MNIDTLRYEQDGKTRYRAATVRHIRAMLGAGHVTHIQTDRGTIAIRPSSQVIDGKIVNGWDVERTISGITDKSQTKFFTRYEQRRLMRATLNFLNGKAHNFAAGDDTTIWSNQAERDANVLAVLGDEVLVEYVMPGTISGRETSALVLCRGVGSMLDRVRSYPHAKLPRRWINAIHEQGWSSLWIGKGQRSARVVDLPDAA